MKAKFDFSCIDNSGKRQAFTVKAESKPEAIKKALVKAQKQAAGDIYSWNCKLCL